MSVLHRLTLSLPPDHLPEDADRLLAFLALRVSHGWEEQSPPTGELRCIVHTPLPEFTAQLAGEARHDLPEALVEEDTLEEQNWVEAWKEFFTPVQGGRHFLVLAPWMIAEREECEARARTGAAPDRQQADGRQTDRQQADGQQTDGQQTDGPRIPVIIEPRTAFGTGHHETTALCLEAVSTLYDEGRLSAGMRFLDLGTGSGILGLACAKLGLRGEGLDIDPPAVDNALENRAVNNVPAEDFAVRPGGLEAAQGPYDLVLANILARPLRDMAPDLAGLPSPRPGKRPLLVLSGLLDIQADAVEAAYIAAGRGRARKLIRGEWAALIFE